MAEEKSEVEKAVPEVGTNGGAVAGRLHRECRNLDPTYEKAFAEEGLEQDVLKWPEY